MQVMVCKKFMKMDELRTLLAIFHNTFQVKMIRRKTTLSFMARCKHCRWGTTRRGPGRTSPRCPHPVRHPLRLHPPLRLQPPLRHPLRSRSPLQRRHPQRRHPQHRHPGHHPQSMPSRPVKSQVKQAKREANPNFIDPKTKLTFFSSP